MDSHASDTAALADNPLVAPSPLQDQAVPFDRIQVEHYLPALDHAIAEAKGRIEEILANPAAADFENTVVALEQAGQEVDRVSSVFYNQLSAKTSDELQALAADFGARSANFSSDVSLDPRVFARVKAVWDGRETLDLKGEKARLLDDTYSGFVRNGALLSDNEKGELRSIDERLAKLTPDFQHNVLKATNAFTLWIEDEADLAGLPEGSRPPSWRRRSAAGPRPGWSRSTRRAMSRS
jgi:peptidyl-dipeptidase Dcp